MTETQLIKKLIRASQGLAYWSKELLKTNKAIQQHIKSSDLTQAQKKLCKNKHSERLAQ